MRQTAAIDPSNFCLGGNLSEWEGFQTIFTKRIIREVNYGSGLPGYTAHTRELGDVRSFWWNKHLELHR